MVLTQVVLERTRGNPQEDTRDRGLHYQLDVIVLAVLPHPINLIVKSLQVKFFLSLMLRPIKNYMNVNHI